MDVEAFFTPLLARDPSGRDWLAALLRAAPRGEARFGELLTYPGSLSMSLSVRGVSGRLGAFEYPLAPSPELVAWLIEHPDRLRWPGEAAGSQQTSRLRRALLFDEPAGARARAQERARELMRSRSILSQEWWRFEDVTTLDCLLMTDRLVVTVDASQEDPGAPVSGWYPSRSRLVRSIEAARELAGERHWGCLLLSDEPRDVGDLLTDEALSGAAPHLEPGARFGLRAGYLGNLTWAQAATAVPGAQAASSPSARERPEAV